MRCLLMATSLRRRLGELASGFASEVLDLIRGSSLDELLAESRVERTQGGGRRPGGSRAASHEPPAARHRGVRLPRRSSTDVAKVVDRIVSLLRRHGGGLRAEQIREELGIVAKELPRPLKEGLDSRRLAKSGQKRATTYFVKAAGRKGRSGKRSTSRTSAAGN